MHQQPPHTPLCFATSRAKSGHVLELSGLKLYVATVLSYALAAQH